MSTPGLTESVSSEGSGSTRINKPWRGSGSEEYLDDYEHLRIVSSSDGMMAGDHVVVGQSEEGGCDILALFKPRGYVIVCMECSRGVWCYEQGDQMVGRHVFAGYVWSHGCMFGADGVGCGAAAAVARDRGIVMVSDVSWDSIEARGAALQLMLCTSTKLRPQEPWW